MPELLEWSFIGFFPISSLAVSGIKELINQETSSVEPRLFNLRHPRRNVFKMQTFKNDDYYNSLGLYKRSQFKRCFGVLNPILSPPKPCEAGRYWCPCRHKRKQIQIVLVTCTKLQTEPGDGRAGPHLLLFYLLALVGLVYQYSCLSFLHCALMSLNSTLPLKVSK